VGEKKSSARLGRGLSTLLGDAPVAATAVAGQRGTGEAPATTPSGEGLLTLPVARIRPNAAQPRRTIDPEALAALAESIASTGLIQPVVVRALGDGDYELIAGERRWRAAQAARLHEIPAVVKDLGDREALEAALVENIQRQDLTPLEEADAYRRLAEEFGHTQDAIARALGKSRAHVANTVRLLALPQAVRDMLAAGLLDAGHARVLLTTPDPEALARRIAADGLSVRQAEALARQAKRPARQPATRDRGILHDADTRAMEKRLESATGLKVALQHKAGSGAGSLTLRYSSLDQFDDLVAKLTR